LVGEEPHARGNQGVDALLLSGDRSNTISNLLGDAVGQTFEGAVNAGTPCCSSGAQCGEACSRDSPGVRSNFSRSSGVSVGLELVAVVRTVEVNGDHVGSNLHRGDGTFIDQNAIGNLVQRQRQSVVDGIRVAGLKRTRQCETDIGVVDNDEAKGRDSPDYFLACTPDLTSGNAECRGDIYKG